MPDRVGAELALAPLSESESESDPDSGSELVGSGSEPDSDVESEVGTIAGQDPSLWCSSSLEDCSELVLCHEIASN